MHVLFVHQNFPAQFGHIAQYLVQNHDFRCTFVTNQRVGAVDGIDVLHYEPQGGATARTHYCSRTFENAVAHAHGVYRACRRRRELRPDLIVGHSGFGSTLFLREVFDCPIINYFEYFYRPRGSDLDFRPEAKPQELDVLRSYCRNGMLLLDLENCDTGYAPTKWQKDRLPDAYSYKVEVIFDGIDTTIWRPSSDRLSPVREGTRLVTYVARGLESMRGFDIFMRIAKRIYEQFPNVMFAVVGEDRVAYGGDHKVTAGKSFKDHVLSQDNYDVSKFVFTGRVQPLFLARLLSASDVHIYLTVPFVLSWSLFNALACGATVLASDTEPVREIIKHGETGLLADFFDVDALAELAITVLRDPSEFRHLGTAGLEMVQQNYSLEKTLPKMLELYQRVTSRHGHMVPNSSPTSPPSSTATCR